VTSALHGLLAIQRSTPIVAIAWPIYALPLQQRKVLGEGQRDISEGLNESQRHPATMDPGLKLAVTT
jgi:hypothetical protein